ncbi:MAG: tRNA (N6-threonylcarbamoyladenosine(37)-N6)-methyltransferase TrmO [Fervidicoccaceae archaeon]
MHLIIEYADRGVAMSFSYICFKPIGYVRHGKDDDVLKRAWRGVEGYIEILPEYSDGLLNLEGFSHIIVISFLHKIGEDQRKVLRIKHRKLERFGIRIDDIPEVGVFASDSPARPNPIGLSIVRLIRVEGNKLFVSGLDLSDGTPVLDIKPYDHGRQIKEIELPQWAKLLEERIRDRFGPEEERLSP